MTTNVRHPVEKTAYMSTGEKKIKIKPGVKVLISSGCDIDDHATEILGKGCNGFIQKPYTLEELSDRLNDMLAKG